MGGRGHLAAPQRNAVPEATTEGRPRPRSPDRRHPEEAAAAEINGLADHAGALAPQPGAGRVKTWAHTQVRAATGSSLGNAGRHVGEPAPP